MSKKAWEYEFETRRYAEIVDFSTAERTWESSTSAVAQRREELDYHWGCPVPGSLAPDSMFLTAIQAWYNLGYDVTEAESFIEAALEAHDAKDFMELECITGNIFKSLNRAPIDKAHIASQKRTCKAWEDFSRDYPEDPDNSDLFKNEKVLFDKIRNGWVAQIAGGSYGTALEGYTGKTIREYYKDKLNGYVTKPETYNDDVTFEIVTLDALKKNGVETTEDDIADGWLKYIPSGWSAEFFALENLRRGIYPPDSGTFCNYYSDWIGAQMRTMVCGFAAPGRPKLAAYLAWMDSRVSHGNNGIIGGIHSAVLSALAFVEDDPRRLLERSMHYIPKETLFHHHAELALHAVKSASGSQEAWDKMSEPLKELHWIHAIPNMVAVVVALYFGEGDITKSFRILAECGLDVDCNAGELGSALGVMNNHVPEKWSAPLGEKFKTYLEAFPVVSFDSLAGDCLEVAKKWKDYKTPLKKL